MGRLPCDSVLQKQIIKGVIKTGRTSNLAVALRQAYFDFGSQDVTLKGRGVPQSPIVLSKEEYQVHWVAVFSQGKGYMINRHEVETAVGLIDGIMDEIQGE